MPADEPTPTIGGILRVARQVEADRACLVRPAKDGRPPALAVLLVGSALAEIGKELESVMRNYINPENSDRLLLTIDLVTPVKMALQWMDEHHQHWRWAEVGKHVCLVFFRGQEVCEEVAEILNAHECPCNLN